MRGPRPVARYPGRIGRGFLDLTIRRATYPFQESTRPTFPPGRSGRALLLLARLILRANDRASLPRCRAHHAARESAALVGCLRPLGHTPRLGHAEAGRPACQMPSRSSSRLREGGEARRSTGRRWRQTRSDRRPTSRRTRHRLRLRDRTRAETVACTDRALRSGGPNQLRLSIRLRRRPQPEPNSGACDERASFLDADRPSTSAHVAAPRHPPSTSRSAKGMSIGHMASEPLR